MSGPPGGIPVLVPIGAFPEDLMRDLSERTGMGVSNIVIDPQEAWSSARGQYNSNILLQQIRRAAGGPVLGASDLDLYIPVLTFVFGEAELGGDAGIFSIYRLREQFYGLPDRPDLVLERAIRELWHELGHMYGLTHCRDAFCVMSPSHSVTQVDAKGERFCAECLMEMSMTGRALPRRLDGRGPVQPR